MARGRPKGTRNRPKAAAEIARQRVFDRRNKKVAVTHLTASEFVVRHQYCVTKRSIMQLMGNDPKAAEIISKDLQKPIHERRYQAHCDHPEDGYCGTSISAETLQKVNDKLAFRAPKEKVNDLGVNNGTIEQETIAVSNGVKETRVIRIGGKLYGPR